MKIPPGHPRAGSLRARELLAHGFSRGIVSSEGLVAHGRGEAFDYMVGEKTRAPARRAARAAAVALGGASRPAVSINGNTAALCGAKIAEFAGTFGAAVEVNTFYGPAARRARIAGYLRRRGVARVYGAGRRSRRVPGLEGPRGSVDTALHEADVVLVALEDGDRTEALVRAGKTVVAIDLNPFSRTARYASITVVDEVSRALPLIASYSGARYRPFDNAACLREMSNIVRRGA